MECKVSDLVKRAHDQSAELKASCGAVDVRDVAQLISDLATQLDVQLARSNALAAENAGLKSAIDATIGWQQSTDPENVESVRMLVDVKTTATDVFLAEVRAQGVEMFSNELGNVHKQLRSGSNHAHAIKSAVFRAVDFAAQLRKGVQS
ncbi:hypothetical protein [Enterobacter hormaechei]|uniref:hypothetical protein n=1 Tax=Enterobacter hormaechei TaxID=158836 RepID=UPI0007930BF9|nr:hypothetical protein [Enterobacter hormaechei]SAE25953.1 Uncharacterised protein [Enterobacter hormaechei]